MRPPSMNKIWSARSIVDSRRNDERDASLQQLLYASLNRPLGLGIYRRGRLIHPYDGRFGEQVSRRKG